MTNKEEQIYNVINPIAKDMGYNIVRVKIMGLQSTVLEILIERLDGESLNISDCSLFTKAISPVLDVHDIIRPKYTLEVSSAGINRPLIKLEDFTKFIESPIKVKVKVAVEGKRNIKGIIKKVDGNLITLSLSYLEHEVETALNDLEITIDFANVDKARLNII